MTNEEYKDFFDSAPVGLWRTEIESGKFLNVNLTMSNMLGYTNPTELLAKTSTNLYSIEERSNIVKELKDLKEVKNIELCVKRKDNSLLWVAISAKIFPDKGYIEGSMVDISEKKQIEEICTPHLQKIISLNQNILQKIKDEDAVYRNLSRKSLKIV